MKVQSNKNQTYANKTKTFFKCKKKKLYILWIWQHNVQHHLTSLQPPHLPLLAYSTTCKSVWGIFLPLCKLLKLSRYSFTEDFFYSNIRLSGSFRFWKQCTVDFKVFFGWHVFMTHWTFATRIYWHLVESTVPLFVWNRLSHNPQNRILLLFIVMKRRDNLRLLQG